MPENERNEITDDRLKLLVIEQVRKETNELRGKINRGTLWLLFGNIGTITIVIGFLYFYVDFRVQKEALDAVASAKFTTAVDARLNEIGGEVQRVRSKVDDAVEQVSRLNLKVETSADSLSDVDARIVSASGRLSNLSQQLEEKDEALQKIDTDLEKLDKLIEEVTGSDLKELLTSLAVLIESAEKSDALKSLVTHESRLDKVEAFLQEPVFDEIQCSKLNLSSKGRKNAELSCTEKGGVFRFYNGDDLLVALGSTNTGGSGIFLYPSGSNKMKLSLLSSGVAGTMRTYNSAGKKLLELDQGVTLFQADTNKKLIELHEGQYSGVIDVNSIGGRNLVQLSSTDVDSGTLLLAQ